MNEKISGATWLRGFILLSIMFMGVVSILLEVAAIFFHWGWDEYRTVFLASFLVVLPTSALLTTSFLQGRRTGGR